MNIWTHFAGLAFFFGITVYFFSGNEFCTNCILPTSVFTQLHAGLFPSHASVALSSISKGVIIVHAATQGPHTPCRPAGLHRGIPSVPWRDWLLDLNSTSFSTQLDHYMDSAMLNAQEVEGRMHALWNSLSAFGVSSFPKFNLDNQRSLLPNRLQLSQIYMYSPFTHILFQRMD